MVSHSQMFFDEKLYSFAKFCVRCNTVFAFIFVCECLLNFFDLVDAKLTFCRHFHWYVRHYITQRIKQEKEFTDSVSIFIWVWPFTHLLKATRSPHSIPLVRSGRRHVTMVWRQQVRGVQEGWWAADSRECQQHLCPTCYGSFQRLPVATRALLYKTAVHVQQGTQHT